MEMEELKRAIEAILFASGERIDLKRLSFALETDAADASRWFAAGFAEAENKSRKCHDGRHDGAV